MKVSGVQNTFRLRLLSFNGPKNKQTNKQRNKNPSKYVLLCSTEEIKKESIPLNTSIRYVDLQVLRKVAYSVLVEDTQVTVCVLHEKAGISECVHVAAHVCVWKNGLWYM